MAATQEAGVASQVGYTYLNLIVKTNIVILQVVADIYT